MQDFGAGDSATGAAEDFDQRVTALLWSRAFDDGHPRGRSERGGRRLDRGEGAVIEIGFDARRARSALVPNADHAPAGHGETSSTSR